MTSETIFATVLAGIGVLVAGIGYYQARMLRSASNVALERELRRLVGENIALLAALRTPTQSPDTNQNEKETANVIRRKATDHFRRAGVLPPDIDYDKLAARVGLGEYYDALEDLYFNSPRNLAILSGYARQLVEVDSPIVLVLDLVSFGKFRRDQGTFPAGEVIEQVRKVVYEEASRRNGSILSSLGDSFLVVFASPDSAYDAASAIQKSIASNPKTRGQSARIAIGMANWREPETLRRIYEIETHARPGFVGLAESLYSWASARGLALTRRALAGQGPANQGELVEVDPA